MRLETENTKSLSGNVWKTSSANEHIVEMVVQRYSLPAVIAKILIARGIEPENIPNFLDPKLQTLMPDPYCLKDMEKAVLRISQAVTENQKIAIIGDYDVDGATSSSLLKLFLEELGCQTVIHIPEREEGYGPSIGAVDKFIAQDCRLLITVDCGTTAFEVFDYAKSKEIDVIVLDHHEAETKLPDVCALVNPKRLDESEDCPDYLRYLAAVGVVFLTIVGINRHLRKIGFYQSHEEPDLTKWLDLVALGTVCDVVPLVGLNRAFVRQGLKVMSQRRNCGLKALIDKASVTEMPSTYHLGYVIGPRINAGGRVGDSLLGNELLCCKDDIKAEVLATRMNEFNDQRKEIEAYVLLSAMETLEGTPQKYPMAFVYGTDWHQGVIGIVAGKLKERYALPSIVMSVENDEVKGSARSVSGLDIGALIVAAKEKGLLTKGGGHVMAAGFSLKEENIEQFREFAGEYIIKALGQDSLSPVIEIDGVLDLAAVNPDMAEKIEVLEPFGAGNIEPKFRINNVRMAKTEIVGSGHVRCFLSSKTGGNVKAVAFRAADNEMGKALLNNNGETFHVVGVMRRDNWQGRNQVQFIIEDAMRAG